MPQKLSPKVLESLSRSVDDAASGHSSRYLCGHDAAIDFLEAAMHLASERGYKSRLYLRLRIGKGASITFTAGELGGGGQHG